MSLALRTTLALFTSFGIILLAGPYFIEFLKRMSLREKTDKSDSDHLNKLHSTKSGTPTMGGFLLLLGTSIACLLWAEKTAYIWIGMAAMISFGAIGFIDDFKKIRQGGGKGLTPRGKMVLQLSFSLLITIAIGFLYMSRSGTAFQATIPGTSFQISIFPLWILLGIMVITGSSNAVNLTDGLDGLAAGSSIPVFLVLMGMAYICGKADLSVLFSVSYIHGVEEMMVLLSALLGGIMGFLWFNCHPAQIFMGDTGSLSLGAMLGVTALILHSPFLLILLAGVFVLETLSVILQVGSYKLWKKRIFRIAPLHHHYQFGGLSEMKITVRFWIVSSLLAMFTALGFLAV